MTFAATGSFLFSDSSALTMNNQGTGNLLLVEVANYTNNTVHCTGFTGGGATWALLATFAGTSQSQYHSMLAGTVTATGSGTATPTWSGTAPGGYEVNGHEFTSTAGSWALDVYGDIDLSNPGTASWASLTPAGNGELYFGFSGQFSSPTAGSTSGYVYSVNGDSDGVAYNVSCPAGVATYPVWGSADSISGLMVLMEETGPSPNPGPPLSQGLLPARPAIIVSNAGWRGAGHSR